jgi:hypothetical protein
MSSETLNYYAPEGIDLEASVARFHVDRIDTVPPGPYYLENDRNGDVHQMVLRGPTRTTSNAMIATFNPGVMTWSQQTAFKILGALNQCETQSQSTLGE